jgi:hypothetical protein
MKNDIHLECSIRLRIWYLTMSCVTLSILFALIVGIHSVAGESHPDDSLLAAAQKAMLGKIAANQSIRALDVGLWNSDRTAVAVSVPQQHPKDSVVFVFLRRPDGTYLATDVSSVETGNFGKLGPPRTDCERFETTPVEWLHRDDGLFQVRIRTRAWRAGQRYTVYEPLIIRPDGAVLYR